MTENWFDDWFQRFWNVYSTKLCRQKGASYEVAKKKYKSRIKSQKKADEIFATLLEQVRYKLKRKEDGAHQSEWLMPGILVYLNQERWEGFTIGSYTENDNRPSQDKCGCGEPIAYAYERLCLTCMGTKVRVEKRQEVADVLKNMGIYVPGESQEELNKKCRAFLKNKQVFGHKVIKNG